ncbi:MAG: hypothetical protein AABX31_00895 [Nanoarchaeota archaeon]
MDKELYRKLMVEPEVLQGIGMVALREAEREIKTKEQDSARKIAANPSRPIFGSNFHRVTEYLDTRSYEERYEELVRRRVGEIFQDYIQRLDLSEELKRRWRVLSQDYKGGNH